MAPIRRSRKSYRKAVYDSSRINTLVQKAIRKRMEPKFFDSTVSTTVSTTPLFFGLTQSIVQGISGAQRIGDNISLLRLQMNYRIEINVANTQLSDVVRVIVMLDKMNDGVAPTQADLLTTTNVTSPYGPEQVKSKRFTILYDSIDFVALGGKNAVVVQRTLNLNQVISYQGVLNAVASNGRNSMWACLIGTNGPTPTSFNMNFQVVFGDP